MKKQIVTLGLLWVVLCLPMAKVWGNSSMQNEKECLDSETVSVETMSLQGKVNVKSLSQAPAAAIVSGVYRGRWCIE